MAVVFLNACSNPTAINGQNFSHAVERYLADVGELCLPVIDWPVEVDPQRVLPKDEIPKIMAAMEAVGLVQREAVVLESQHTIDRYTLSDNAQPFLKIKKNHPPNTAPVLCWGQMALDKIVKWSAETLIADHDGIATVTFTYQVEDIAPWANDIGMRWAFPDIKSIQIDQARPVKAQLKRTEHAWEVDHCNKSFCSAAPLVLHYGKK